MTRWSALCRQTKRDLAMHAVKLLQKCLRSALEPMHARRREALLGSVASLVEGRRLVLMDLARSWSGYARVAAPLKRVDRLLSNTHLAKERESIYAAMGRWCLCQRQPVIIVDWSPVGRRGKHYLLRAALAVGLSSELWNRQTSKPQIRSMLRLIIQPPRHLHYQPAPSFRPLFPTLEQAPRLRAPSCKHRHSILN